MAAAISQRVVLLKLLLVVTAFIMPVALTLLNYGGSGFGEAITAVTPRRVSYHSRGCHIGNPKSNFGFAMPSKLTAPQIIQLNSLGSLCNIRQRGNNCGPERRLGRLALEADDAVKAPGESPHYGRADRSTRSL